MPRQVQADKSGVRSKSFFGFVGLLSWQNEKILSQVNILQFVSMLCKKECVYVGGNARRSLAHWPH